MRDVKRPVPQWNASRASCARGIFDIAYEHSSSPDDALGMGELDLADDSI